MTNEEAMNDLMRLKNKQASTSEALRHYYAGVLYGSAGAYWRAKIITVEQYYQYTEPESATA